MLFHKSQPDAPRVKLTGGQLPVVRFDLQEKQLFLARKSLKAYYKQQRKDLVFRHRYHALIRKLSGLRIRNKLLSTVRWVVIDFLRLKPAKFWGIYCYVALPGEGKTLSMVAHMERCLKTLGKEKLFIATNFHYLHEDMQIISWVDMILASKAALSQHKYCIVAIDEIHTTFDASDWKSFPQELLALLSFNRKYGMQFICSSQVYDRIPRKIRDISNYTVLCKNTLGLDRHFINYYFDTNNYEDKFAGKRTKANFIRTYVADDYLYSLYNTLAQVDNMASAAVSAKDERQKAFDLLFGGSEHAENEDA